MDEIRYSIRVSPEVLSSDIVSETFNGDSGLDTFGIYSGMSYILSGNTNGTSFLTGMTIPIVFTQSLNDIGVYSEFDGDLLQKDVITNFLYSADTINPYDVYVYNTSGDLTISYLSFSTFYVDWGDGTPTQQITNQPLLHTYLNTPDTYTISFSGSNTWGTTVIQKQIILPLTGVTIANLEGTVTLTPQSGNWSGIPTTYDFIFTGDSQNNYPSQISSTYTQIPFPVSGFTTSKLTDLKRYGPVPYTIGYQFFKNNQLYGQVDDINQDYTEYTINGIKYYDFTNGTTLYLVDSSGFTQDNITLSAITKNERLLDFVFDPEVQSNVYIERGKYTAFEPLQRLGEVDNIGDLTRYGYNYYKINTV
jgi:hypothetical protein